MACLVEGGSADQRRELHGRRVGRWQVALVGELVGPVRAGVDPPADGLDLLVRKRVLERHLRAEARIGYATVEAADITAARDDVVAHQAAECGAAPVEPVAVLVL